MLIEKLYMFVYSCISTKHKLSWFRMWNEFVVFWKAKKFSKFGFSDSQFDKWLHKANFWLQVFYFWMTIFFHFLSRTLFLISLLFLQLEIEVFKLFDAIVSDFSLVVREVSNMISLSSHIQQWRLAVWEICVFREFKPNDGIQKSKSWEQQFGSKEGIKRVLQRYSNYKTSFHSQATTN